ncbi:N-acetylmuramate alpha-1-phosphate uridylyltransferase MurU [Orrella sp. 11846]|uniref:N-acetylmuramate alpha-1-phosphate uridylyltransferase MurU n=1 Tax=Orrella sp. 11846 TaxID=3409913 RepID=UPI003B5AE6D9
MRAMLLAAGRGQRMRPLTDTTPKPLLKVGGLPLIEWHLRHLSKAGFQEVVVNHAWLGAQIETFLGDGSNWNLRIHHSPETQALETAGGIVGALPFLGEEPFLVINADVWTDWNPLQALDIAQRFKAHPEQLAHLVLVPNPPHHPEGDFTLTTDGFVHSPSDAAMNKLTFSGIGIYRPELFKSLAVGQEQALAPVLRHQMSQQKVRGSLYTGQWHDIGTVERLTWLDQKLSDSNSPKNLTS